MNTSTVISVICWSAYLASRHDVGVSPAGETVFGVGNSVGSTAPTMLIEGQLAGRLSTQTGRISSETNVSVPTDVW